SRSDQGQRDGGFSRAAKPDTVDRRIARATDRRNACASQGRADKRVRGATLRHVERGKGGLGGGDRLVSIRGRSDQRRGRWTSPEGLRFENQIPGARDRCA